MKTLIGQSISEQAATCGKNLRISVQVYRKMWPEKDKKRSQQQLRWETVATLDMSRKEGEAAVPLSRGELGPRLTCDLGRGQLPYQVAS